MAKAKRKWLPEGHEAGGSQQGLLTSAETGFRVLVAWPVMLTGGVRAPGIQPIFG
jgi:hypothetical protein